jgi:hypothetical protein
MTARIKTDIQARSINNNYWIIFGKTLGWLLLGAAAGFAFFYFFKDLSVLLINKFKFLQNIFGIREYQEGMSFANVLLMIAIGNLVSTAAYFTLGYLRALIPIAILSGFFVIVLLMAGTVRHLTAIPMEVILLSSVETLYRMLALTTGEHLQRNRFRKRWVLIVPPVMILLLLVLAVVYEMMQIFG